MKGKDFSEKDEVILKRAQQDLLGEDHIVLGKGLPERLQSLFSPAPIIEFLSVSGTVSSCAGTVVVEASEVSSSGDLVVFGCNYLAPLKSARMLVLTHHTRTNGDSKLVEFCEGPVTCNRCAKKIISELGVISIDSSGFVLTEVTPDIATDEVKVRTAASLHISDSIKIMLL